MLDPVLVAGDEYTAKLAVEALPAVIVQERRHRVEPLDHQAADRILLVESDRRAEDQDPGPRSSAGGRDRHSPASRAGSCQGERQDLMMWTEILPAVCVHVGLQKGQIDR
jgi:hypothetical protein